MSDMNISEVMDNRKSILELYKHEIQQLEHVYHTTSGILYSCVLAVVSHHFESLKIGSDSNNMNSQKENEVVGISNIYLPSGDIIKISDGSNSNFHSLFDSNDFDFFENSIITSEVDDSLRYIWAKSAGHATVEGLQHFQSHALIRSQINTLLIDNKFQLKPEMTSTERGIKETEILSFTSLSTADLYRNDQLQAFFEMLKSHVQVLPNFTGALKSGDGEDGSILHRRYFRQIPASTFAQILITERMREPVVLKDYYTMTDDLLYVLHWPPPERRIKKSTWVKTVVLTGTPIVVNSDSITTTDNKKKKNSVISKKKGKDNENKENNELTGILNYEIKTTTLTPAAHSIAHIKKSNLSMIPWLSIYINGSIIGLRIENEIDSNLELDDTKSIESSNTMKYSLNGEIQDGPILGNDESSLLLKDGRKGMFFCHTEDDVRFVTCSGPLQLCKPDGFGTACLIASYTDEMIITICTNGITKVLIPPATLAYSSNDGAGIELERFVGVGGTVMSIFSKDGPSYNGVRFRKEIKESNGNRLLIRWLDIIQNDDLELDTNNSQPHTTTVAQLRYHSFYEELCSSAPVGWTCVKLGMDGSVTFYFCPTDCTLLNSSVGVSHSMLNNKMKQTVIDAETKCSVTSFMDGRLIITYCDGRIESRFGDGTIMTTHDSGAMMTISKPCLPTIEIDTEIDAVSRQHARGVEVPINKGGDRVRSRIALPDGSAVFVKYNTLLTATSNGSIKLIRRDKTIILVSDSGITTYLPRTAWNENAAAEFSKDCIDFEVNLTKEKDRISTNNGINFNTNNSLTSCTTMNTKNKTSRTTNKIKPPMNTKDSSSSTYVEEDVFVDKKEKDASITIDYIKCTCKILDHLYNSFDINLSENALDPIVVLSGEVDGLKPLAVADKPMDPRMFIVSRSADAIELLSMQNVTSIETFLKSSSDVKKVSSKIELQPSDPGTSNQHQYFIQRRLLGSVGDNFTFEEVFGSRIWHPTLDHIPAAGLYFIRKDNQDTSASSTSVSAPRFYEKITICEQNPLSLEGHADLRKAIKKCEEFRLARLQSIDRFKVDEDRSKEELDEEEALAKRLKLAFKTAKTMVAKKKEQKLKDNTTTDNNSVVSSMSGGAVVLNNIQGITIVENLNEDAEDDEDTASFYEDEVSEEVLSTEELELKDTFQDFSSQPNNNHEEAFYISKDMLQDAYIRLFNRYITQDLIIKELDQIDDCDPNFKEFTFIEFRDIYYRIKTNLSVNRKSSSSDMNLVSSTIAHNNNVLHDDNDDDLESSVSYNSEEHSHSSPTYWQSTPGKSAIISLPVTIAPSLDFRKLKREEDSDVAIKLDTDEIEPVSVLNEHRMVSTAGAGYPVGSAFQVVRNRAFTAPE